MEDEPKLLCHQLLFNVCEVAEVVIMKGCILSIIEQGTRCMVCVQSLPKSTRECLDTMRKSFLDQKSNSTFKYWHFVCCKISVIKRRMNQRV